MPDIDKKRRMRALLTDTLPYEVPVIFSNELFYASLIRTPASDRVKGMISRLRPALTGYTQPYQYHIRKERQTWNTLSIVHPLAQVEAAIFIATYAETIVNECNKSPASLRRPAGVALTHTAEKIYEIACPKIGAVQGDALEGELDVSRISSFFVYRDYNLLAKFFDSDAFLDLEKRFSRFQTFDVRKCFLTSIRTASLGQ